MTAHPLHRLGNGEVLSGRYRLVEPLASGGTATVWRAIDQHLRRQVAVKVLDQRRLADSVSRARLHIEAQALAQLTHPRIAAVYDFDSTDLPGGSCLPYVVMELVDGIPLSALQAPMPWRAAAALTAQVADAAAAAHARGVVHRDLSAANVLLNESGVKVIDFGICALTGDPDRPLRGQIVGTPAYLAPERIEGRPVSPAVDVYAMGVLLYYALAGRWPWPAVSTEEFLVAHRTLDPAPLDVGDLPPSVARICLQCLSKDPAQRPSAAQLATTLHEIAGPAELTLLRDDPALGAPDQLTQVVTFTGATEVKALRRLLKDGLPRRRHWRAGAAIAAVGVLAAVLAGLDIPSHTALPQAMIPAGPPLPAVASPTSITCHVSYQRVQITPGRYTAEVSVTNNEDASTRSGWQLRFMVPGQQTLESSATQAWHQNGAAVISAPAAADLPPAEPVLLAPHELHSVADAAAPTLFWLNDRLCAATVITGESAIAVPAIPAVAKVPATGRADGPKSGKQKPASKSKPGAKPPKAQTSRHGNL